MVFLPTHNRQAGVFIICISNQSLRAGNWLSRVAQQVSSKAGWNPRASDRIQVSPELSWSSLLRVSISPSEEELC